MPKAEIEPAPAVSGELEIAAQEPKRSGGSQANRAPDAHLIRTPKFSPSTAASDAGQKEADSEGASKQSETPTDDEEFMDLADSVDAAPSLAYRPGKPGYRGRLWVFSDEEWEEMQGILESDGTTSLERESRINDLDSVFNVRVAIPTKHRKYRSLCWLPILDPFSKFVIIWSNFLMVFDLTYTAFFLPISVGFKTDMIDLNTNYDTPVVFMLVVDVLAAVVFTVALAMGFHTGFIGQYNLRQALVMDGSSVAKFYIHKGAFFIDLISCVVFIIEIALIPVRLAPDSIGSGNTVLAYWVLNVLQLLRMVRLVALFYTIQKILLRVTVGESEGGGSQRRQLISNLKIYILIIAYLLFFLINAVACFWFFIGSCYADNNIVNWIAEAQHADGDRPSGDCHLVNYRWVYQGSLAEGVPGCEDYTAADFPKLSFPFAYTLSLYWSVTTLTTVGYGDITPQNSGEILTAMAVMMLGIGAFALLIGSIQEVFANASETAVKASFIRSKLEKVDKWMSQRKLPSGIRGSIRRFYHDAWIQRHKADLEVEIFNDLPQQLQNQVATHLTDHILHKTPIIKEIPADARALMASKLRPITIGVGEDICEQGEDADRLWILQSGVMVAMYGRVTKSDIAEAPCLIGETTILQDVDPEFERRPCSYRATEICNLWELRIRDLQVIQRIFPEANTKLHEGVAEHILSRAGIKTVKGRLDSEAISFLVDEVQQASLTENSGPSHLSIVQSHTSAAALRHGFVSTSDGNIEVDGIGEVRMSGILNLALDAVSDEEEREAYKKKINETNVPESSAPSRVAQNNTSFSDNEDATLRQLLCEVLFRTKSLEGSVAEMRRNSRFGASGSPQCSPRSPIHLQTHAISSPHRSPVMSPQRSRFVRARDSAEQ